MRVKMKVAIAGADFSRRPGKVYDLPEAEAKHLVATGQATLLDATSEQPAPETASVAPNAEHATKQRGRPRKLEKP